MLIIVCNLTIIIKGIFLPDEPPSMFGVAMLVDMSDCMEEIDEGDLIFIVHEDVENLYEGDIIAFIEGRQPGLARIIREANNSEWDKEIDGIGYIIKADNYSKEFSTILNEKNLLGLYRYKIPRIGYFVLWGQTLLGIFILVVIPLTGNIIYEIYLNKKHKKLHEEKEDADADRELNIVNNKLDTEDELTFDILDE